MALRKDIRNRRMLHYFQSHPATSKAAIGRMFHLTRQRVWRILKTLNGRRDCSTCYHYQEFQHCSRREPEDNIRAINGYSAKDVRRGRGMIDKRLRIKIDSLAKQIMQMSGDLSELQDEMTALFDEVYGNGSDDGYEEAEKERKTAKETIASLPVIDDPVISDALRDVGL